MRDRTHITPDDIDGNIPVQVLTDAVRDFQRRFAVNPGGKIVRRRDHGNCPYDVWNDDRERSRQRHRDGIFAEMCQEAADTDFLVNVNEPPASRHYRDATVIPMRNGGIVIKLTTTDGQRETYVKHLRRRAA